MVSIMWKKTTINKYIVSLVVMFPLVIPEGMATIASTFYNLMFKYGRLLSFVIILMLFAMGLKKGTSTIPVPLKLSLTLAFYCMSVTVLRGHSLNDWVNVFWPCIFAGLIVEHGKRDTDILINSLLIILEFWIYINLIFVIIYPSGMYVSKTIGYTKNWIIGYKSSFQYLIFPAVVLEWIQSTYSKKRLRFWALLAVCLVESVLSENAMLVVALVIVSVCYLFKIVELRKVFNPTLYSIVILILNLIFIFSLTALVNTKLGSMFLNHYGKSTTLGGRASYIWPITIQKISQSPVLGYGIWSSDERRALYLNKPAAIHSHNQLLEMLFIGGIVFLIIYTVFHFQMYKKAKHFENLPSTKIIMFGLFIFYCMMTVEIFMRHTSFPIWVIIYLAFITSEIDKKYVNAYGAKNYKKERFSMKLRY